MYHCIGLVCPAIRNLLGWSMMKFDVNQFFATDDSLLCVLKSMEKNSPSRPDAIFALNGII